MPLRSPPIPYYKASMRTHPYTLALRAKRLERQALATLREHALTSQLVTHLRSELNHLYLKRIMATCSW